MQPVLVILVAVVLAAPRPAVSDARASAGKWLAGAAAQDKPEPRPADVAGTWDLTVNSPNGTGTRVVKIRQDGEKLTGEYESSMGAGTLAGTVKERAIDFTVTVAMELGTFEIRYTGKVDGDKMAGEVDFGDYGKGSWSGTRRN